MRGLEVATHATAAAASSGRVSSAAQERQGSGRDSMGDTRAYLLTSLRTTNANAHANTNAPPTSPTSTTITAATTTTAAAAVTTNNKDTKLLDDIASSSSSSFTSSSFFSSTSSFGGESPSPTRDPDLRRSSSGSPSLSLPPSPVSISSSASSVLFREGLTRLTSFVDLARLHQEHGLVGYSTQAETCNYYDDANDSSPGDWETIQDDEDEYPEYFHAGPDAGLTISNIATTAKDNSSTFYSESSPTILYTHGHRSPSHTTSFFDPSPSSAGESPRTPFYPSYSGQSFASMAPRQLVTPEPTEPATYCTSAAGLQQQQQQQQHHQLTMKNAQWRPSSAPKTVYSRSASPLTFWNRRIGASGNGHQQLQDDREECEATRPRAATSRGYDGNNRDDGDNMLVDTVSNHLGRMTPPSPSNSTGTSSSNSRRKNCDLKLSTRETARSPNCDDILGRGQPPMITKAEYEALPLAIQRKYFSTLERLRFAQESDEVDRIFDHYESQNTTAAHHQHHHRKHRPALSSPETLCVPNSRRLRDSLATAISDDSWVVNYPEKVNKAALTRAEQVRLIRHLRASVILDAAGEAITKLHRPNERNLSPTPDIEYSSGTLSTRRGSLDSMTSAMLGSEATNGRDVTRESLYDSFRWLDEEENLDLSLFLDDYHANLREEVPQTSKNRRPSFRRHLSISKLPFGRPAVSSNRPETKDTKDTSPTQSPIAAQHPSGTQRRLSRTLSVINPNKHAHSEPVSVIDSTATHYQDPEARQKLRAYLASEQKFDEALQFGFPATDSPQGPATLDQRSRKRQSRLRLRSDDEPMRSFLDFDGDEDDEQSDRDDRSSISDPDSPLTPQIDGGLTPPPGHKRPTRVNTDPLNQRASTAYHRQTSAPSKPMSRDSYAQFNGTSREMTLRMTLTRPDLRADDELIYGWQPQAVYTSAGRKSTGPLPRDSVVLKDPMPREETPTLKGQTTTACWSESQANKESIEKMLAEMDHYGTENATGDRGVMKRIWNRVRRT